MKDKNESQRVSLEELTAEFALLLKEHFSDGRVFKISVEEV